MENIIDQLDFVLPAFLVIVIAVYMLKKVLNHDHQRRVFEYKKSVAKEMIPLRMQAFERLTLFMERMQPQNLLPRVQTAEMNTMQLHRILIQTIRNEYDHNMSQQVYISDKTWTVINQAKDQLITLINEQVRTVPPQAPGTHLGKLILEGMLEEQKWLIDEALLSLKQELKENY
jgi:hypothetical protein